MIRSLFSASHPHLVFPCCYAVDDILEISGIIRWRWVNKLHNVQLGPFLHFFLVGLILWIGLALGCTSWLNNGVCAQNFFQFSYILLRNYNSSEQEGLGSQIVFSKSYHAGHLTVHNCLTIIFPRLIAINALVTQLLRGVQATSWW